MGVAQGGQTTVNFEVNASNPSIAMDGDVSLRRQIFEVALSSLQADGRNVSLGDASAIGTILNDDATPVAHAGGPYLIDEGAELVLNGSVSTDADNDDLSYRWDVDGDGDFDENIVGATRTLTSPQLAALGLDDGPQSKVVTLEVSDGSNANLTTTTLKVRTVNPNLHAITSSATMESKGRISAVQCGRDGRIESATFRTPAHFRLPREIVAPCTVRANRRRLAPICSKPRSD